MRISFSAVIALFALALGALAPAAATAQVNRPAARISEIAPNPLVLGTTRISFVVPSAGEYNLKIFTVSGSFVASVLESEAAGGGEFTTAWDGRAADGTPVANGIYFCRLQFGRIIQAMPVVVMR